MEIVLHHVLIFCTYPDVWGALYEAIRTADSSLEIISKILRQTIVTAVDAINFSILAYLVKDLISAQNRFGSREFKIDASISFEVSIIQKAGKEQIEQIASNQKVPISGVYILE